MWVDLVNAYTDTLLSDNLSVSDFETHAARSGDLAGLFRLTNQIAALLVPVEPKPEFVQELGEELVSSVAPTRIRVAQPNHRNVWLGVLYGSLVSAVGVLALWLMRRNRRSTVVAG